MTLLLVVGCLQIIMHKMLSIRFDSAFIKHRIRMMCVCAMRRVKNTLHAENEDSANEQQLIWMKTNVINNINK